MAILDGVTKKFANRLIATMEKRIEKLLEQFPTETDPFTKMKIAISAECLAEVINAIKVTIDGNGEESTNG